MKRRETQSDANWSGAPSLIHRWMEALLRLIAMSLVSLASLFGMRLGRLARECHTGVAPEALPQSDRDPIRKETLQAVQQDSQTTNALMPNSERCSLYPEPVEGSEHGDMLTAASDTPSDEHRDHLDFCPLIPANARRRRTALPGGPQGLFRVRSTAARQNKAHVELSLAESAEMCGHIAPA